MFKEHEKFWAFTLLLFSVLALAFFSKGEVTYVMVDGHPVPVNNGLSLRDALIGIIGILGSAANALFRINEGAKDMNELLRTTVEKLGNSVPTNDNSAPAPQDAKDAADRVAGAAEDEANRIGGTKP